MLAEYDGRSTEYCIESWILKATLDANREQTGTVERMLDRTLDIGIRQLIGTLNRMLDAGR